MTSTFAYILWCFFQITALIAVNVHDDYGDEGPSTPGGFGLRSPKRARDGRTIETYEVSTFSDLLERSIGAVVGNMESQTIPIPFRIPKSKSIRFPGRLVTTTSKSRIGSVTPTPKSFSDIFTNSQKPFISDNDVDNWTTERGNTNEATTKRTALTTFKAFLDNIQFKEENQFDYDYYEYYDDDEIVKPPKEKKERPKIVPKQRIVPKINKVKTNEKLVNRAPTKNKETTANKKKSRNNNKENNVMDIILPTITIHEGSLEEQKNSNTFNDAIEVSTERIGYTYKPPPDDKPRLNIPENEKLNKRPSKKSKIKPDKGYDAPRPNEPLLKHSDKTNPKTSPKNKFLTTNSPEVFSAPTSIANLFGIEEVKSQEAIRESSGPSVVTNQPRPTASTFATQRPQNAQDSSSPLTFDNLELPPPKQPYSERPPLNNYDDNYDIPLQFSNEQRSEYDDNYEVEDRITFSNENVDKSQKFKSTKRPSSIFVTPSYKETKPPIIIPPKTPPTYKPSLSERLSLQTKSPGGGFVSTLVPPITTVTKSPTFFKAETPTSFSELVQGPTVTTARPRSSFKKSSPNLSQSTLEQNALRGQAQAPGISVAHVPDTIDLQYDILSSPRQSINNNVADTVDIQYDIISSPRQSVDNDITYDELTPPQQSGDSRPFNLQQSFKPAPDTELFVPDTMDSFEKIIREPNTDIEETTVFQRGPQSPTFANIINPNENLDFSDTFTAPKQTNAAFSSTLLPNIDDGLFEAPKTSDNSKIDDYSVPQGPIITSFGSQNPPITTSTSYSSPGTSTQKYSGEQSPTQSYTAEVIPNRVNGKNKIAIDINVFVKNPTSLSPPSNSHGPVSTYPDTSTSGLTYDTEVGDSGFAGPQSFEDVISTHPSERTTEYISSSTSKASGSSTSYPSSTFHDDTPTDYDAPDLFSNEGFDYVTDDIDSSYLKTPVTDGYKHPPPPDLHGDYDYPSSDEPPPIADYYNEPEYVIEKPVHHKKANKKGKPFVHKAPSSYEAAKPIVHSTYSAPDSYKATNTYSKPKETYHEPPDYNYDSGSKYFNELDTYSDDYYYEPEIYNDKPTYHVPKPPPPHHEPEVYHEAPRYVSEPRPRGYYQPIQELIPELKDIIKPKNWNVHDFRDWKNLLDTSNFGGTLNKRHGHAKQLFDDDGIDYKQADRYHRATDKPLYREETVKPLHNPQPRDLNLYYENTASYPDEMADYHKIVHHPHAEIAPYNQPIHQHDSYQPATFGRHTPILPPEPFAISFDHWLDSTGVDSFGAPSSTLRSYAHVPQEHKGQEHIGPRHHYSSNHQRYNAYPKTQMELPFIQGDVGSAAYKSVSYSSRKLVQPEVIYGRPKWPQADNLVLRRPPTHGGDNIWSGLANFADRLGEKNHYRGHSTGMVSMGSAMEDMYYSDSIQKPVYTLSRPNVTEPSSLNMTTFSVPSVGHKETNNVTTEMVSSVNSDDVARVPKTFANSPPSEKITYLDYLFVDDKLASTTLAKMTNMLESYFRR